MLLLISVVSSLTQRRVGKAAASPAAAYSLPLRPTQIHFAATAASTGSTAAAGAISPLVTAPKATRGRPRKQQPKQIDEEE